ncbi:MAG: ATP-binding protein [Thermodesulfobacteriota bacterium]
MNQRLSLELPANLTYLALAAQMAGQAASCVIPRQVNRVTGQAYSHAFELALSEAFTNAVQHQDDGAPPDLRVKIEFEFQGCGLGVTIKDQNNSFNLAAVPAPDFSSHGDGGYGLFLIQQVMDHVSYERQQGWNVVSLSKKLSFCGQ